MRALTMLWKGFGNDTGSQYRQAKCLGSRPLLISAGLPRFGEKSEKKAGKTGCVGREKVDEGHVIIDSVSLLDD